MNRPKIKYRKSTAYTYKATQYGEVIIKEILPMYKKFKVTASVYEILCLFDSPVELELCFKKFNTKYSEEEINKTLIFFQNEKLIVEQDSLDTFIVMETPHPIFGLAQQPYNQISKSLVVVGVPYGGGNLNNKGSENFPYYFRKYLKKYGFNFNNRFLTQVFKHLKYDKNTSFSHNNMYDIGNLFLYKDEYKDSIYSKIEKLSEIIFRKNNIPFFLGGDHSITFPILAGASKIFPEIQVIHLDAHTDTYISEIHELYQKAGIASHHHGNFLSESLKQVDNIIKVLQIGIRGIPNNTIKSNEKIDIFYMKEFTKEKLKEKIKSLACDIPVYLTIDIDFFDPLIAPANSTPVINGADFNNFKNIIEIVKQEGINIIGIDIVEVNPELDKSEITLQLITEIFLYLFTHINLPIQIQHQTKS